MIKTTSQFLFVMCGLALVGTGASVLLLGTTLLPDTVRTVIVHIGRNDPHTLHIMQEAGCLLVLSGLMSFWFASHYELSRTFHWMMTLFWALFALIHWFDTNGVRTTGRGHVWVSIPAVVFLVVGLLRGR